MVNLKFWQKNKSKANNTQTGNTLSSSLNRVSGIKTSWQWGFDSFQLDLNYADYKKAYHSNPIMWHGINKKSRDLLFDGFKIDSPIDGVDVPDEIEQDINNFLWEKQITWKMYRAVIEGFYSGRNGWIEYVCEGNKDPQQPLNGQLVDVVYVNCETITGAIYDDSKTFVEFWKTNVKDNAGEYIKIHHSRLEPLCFYPEGNKPFSVSVIEIAQRAISADNDATDALKNNLNQFGSPFMVGKTTDNVNTKQVDDMYTAFNRMRKKRNKLFGFVGFKDMSFDLLNPATPNPDPTLKHFYIELSAALEMPMILLTGSQMSKLTGNEIELNDYYKSISSMQEIHLSPIYHKMFRLLLGDRWKSEYQIYWNPLFVDETSKIENETKLMKEVGMLYEKGVVEVAEARQLLRLAGVDIPENNPLDEEEPEPPPSDEDISTPYETEPSEMTVKKPTVRNPTKEELALAKKRRKLGEEMIKKGYAK